MYKDFNRDRAETATRVWPFKKVDRTKIQFKGNRLVGQTEQDGSGWYWKISGREVRPDKK